MTADAPHPDAPHPDAPHPDAQSQAAQGSDAEAPDVSIGGEMIRLGQFLKFSGLLDTGGDAKEAIIDGFVTVNGEVERRRGRQLFDGDVVEVGGRAARVRP